MMRTALQASALAALLLLLFCGASEALNLTVHELPKPVQTNRRLLATITVATINNVTHGMLAKQLQNYVEMCEIGYEVHVVLVAWDTGSNDTNAVDSLLFRPPTGNHCSRLEMALPVAVVRYPDGGHHLAARHREVMSMYLNSYDYFISQEHDMDVRARHLIYFVKWSRIFRNASRPTMPCFTRYEVVMRQPITNTLLDANSSDSHHAAASHISKPQRDPRWHHPASVMHITADAFTLIEVNNITCVAPFKAYSAFYIITQDQLRFAMSKKAWKSDIDTPWKEFNTHFQYHWMMHYWTQVIPVVELRHSLVHHGSDKYTPNLVTKSLNYTKAEGHEGFSDTAELQYLIANCTGQFTDWAKHVPYHYPSLMHGNTVVKYNNFLNRTNQQQPHPCAACLRAGKGALVRAKFTGPSLAGQPYKPHGLMEAGMHCVDQIPQQMREACLPDPAKCFDQHSLVEEHPAAQGEEGWRPTDYV